jgi:hypothetical protein
MIIQFGIATPRVIPFVAAMLMRAFCAANSIAPGHATMFGIPGCLVSKVDMVIGYVAWS